MGFFTRLKTGWALARDSVGVLRREPSLAVFPLIAGIAGTVYMALILGGAGLLTGGESGPLLYLALFVVYLGSTFIAAFFTAALTWNTREVFRGDDPTLRDGLDAAWANRAELLAWAVIAAIVGVILRVVERQNNPLAELAASIFGVAWGILTYFVIPVIVFEDVTVRELFERSGSTFKDTWGETIGAGFGVGIITALFTLAGLLLAVIVFVAFGASVFGLVGGLVIAAVVLLLASLFGAALGSVAKTALYVYATEGERPAGFEDVDFAATAR